MLNLLKHLKPFISSMILALALLFVQAICDLSLPDYMSNIVNVGIQQGGVENAVPKVIKASEMKKLFIFINNDEKNVVDDNYTLLDKDSLTKDEYNKYVKDNPELKNESIYKLNTKEKEKRKDYVKPEKVERGGRDIALFDYIVNLYYTTRLDQEEILLLA